LGRFAAEPGQYDHADPTNSGTADRPTLAPPTRRTFLIGTAALITSQALVKAELFTGPVSTAESHNDYLRVLAEYGPLNLIVFVSFLVYIHNNLQAGAPRVLFVVLCIYFFSENLLDNFTAMAIYFAYAGRLTSASSKMTKGWTSGPNPRPQLVDRV
jgi:hypothetical protein